MPEQDYKPFIKKDNYVRVKVSTVTKIKWKLKAKEEGLPLSVIVRNAVNEHFNITE